MARAQLDKKSRNTQTRGTEARNTEAMAPNVIPLGRPGSRPVPRRDGTIFEIAQSIGSDRRFIAAGAELFAEGETSDNLYIVLDGWLMSYRILEDGRRQILDFALPGTVLGYRSHPETPFAATVEAITDAEVAIIPLSRISALLYRRSDCAITLLEAANRALIEAFDTLTDVGRRTAREAIAHFLLRMDRRVRQIPGNETRDSIPFPLTQEHIGDALGLTAVHVCRTLRTLRADGLIEPGRGHLLIRHKEALAEEAGAFQTSIGDTRLVG